MARRSSNNKSTFVAIIVILAIGVIGAVVEFVLENKEFFIALAILAVVCGIAGYIFHVISCRQRNELMYTVLSSLNLRDIDEILYDYDTVVTVKSRQALDNYDDKKYLKENDCFDEVKRIIEKKAAIKNDIEKFLDDNEYKQRFQYEYVSDKLYSYIPLADGYRIKVTYITPAGNNKGEKIIKISEGNIKIYEEHPEYLMTKAEHNKMQKQQEKENLEEKKQEYYEKSNAVIDCANDSKDNLIIPKRIKELDELITDFSNKIIEKIKPIKQIDSDEWDRLDTFIFDTGNRVEAIIGENDKICQYYESAEFKKIKDTCESLNNSRKEFNEYIKNKEKTITKLFGKRIERKETTYADTYNYVRVYKKTISPFTAGVSAAVYSSAENKSLDYVIKYFYPNTIEYEDYIQKLKVLLEEMQTLKEAKTIINNYKKDYDQYIKEVPRYILDNDEDGFYSRLGMEIIDEAILNFEYRFEYTSYGGLAQRSFSVPMSEENIIEIINKLKSKLSMKAQTKEQRALMTTKLRTHIKERDKYTCCQCGNSTMKEPNLLLEVDHIIPIAKGGLTKEDNLQTLCWKCNRSKGAKLPDMY